MAAEKLELLILKTLALEPLHGYGIARRIEQVSQGVFKVTLGSLYPALQRLEKLGARRGGVESQRERTPRALLPADGEGKGTAPGGARGVGARVGGDDARAEGDVRGMGSGPC